jgi:hypothetical protein
MAERATHQTTDARLRDMVARLQRKAVRSVSSSTAITEADDVLYVDASGGAVTLSTKSPAAVFNGRIFYLQRIAGANAVTFDPMGAETIDGAATKAITTPVAIISDGTSWRTILA